MSVGSSPYDLRVPIAEAVDTRALVRLACAEGSCTGQTVRRTDFVASSTFSPRPVWCHQTTRRDGDGVPPEPCARSRPRRVARSSRLTSEHPRASRVVRASAPPRASPRRRRTMTPSRRRARSRSPSRRRRTPCPRPRGVRAARRRRSGRERRVRRRVKARRRGRRRRRRRVRPRRRRRRDARVLRRAPRERARKPVLRAPRSRRGSSRREACRREGASAVRPTLDSSDPRVAGCDVTRRRSRLFVRANIHGARGRLASREIERRGRAAPAHGFGCWTTWRPATLSRERLRGAQADGKMHHVGQEGRDDAVGPPDASSQAQVSLRRAHHRRGGAAGGQHRPGRCACGARRRC